MSTRREDDDPHHVDEEVPVDPADLDAVVVLGGEVATEGADRHRRLRIVEQADKHVAAVKNRETKKKIIGKAHATG